MHILIWLMVGGLTGWIASLMMHTDHEQGILLNVAVGVVGALLGGWLVSPMLGLPSINQQDYSPLSLFVSLAGAAVLLAIVNLLRRRTSP